MKKITPQQIAEILNLLRNYNIGVKDFISVQELFQNLPLVIDEAKNETKDEAKIEE